MHTMIISLLSKMNILLFGISMIILDNTVRPELTLLPVHSPVIVLGEILAFDEEYGF